MPIGKNSIKRAALTHAPETEYSTPVPEAPQAPAAPEVKKTAGPKKAASEQKPRGKVGRPRKAKTAPTAEKKAPTGQAKRKTAAPKSENKAKTPAKTAEGFERIEIGSQMPIYLL